MRLICDPITDFTLSIKDNVDYTLDIKNMVAANSYTVSVVVSNVERAPLSSTPVSNSTEKASGLSEKRIHLGKLKKDQIVAVIIIETDASGKRKPGIINIKLQQRESGLLHLVIVPLLTSLKTDLLFRRHE
ncbi:MAG: hypothetical protein IPL42_02275 [Saprospiraceae bacterium]|nr:hypothetical protein [Saprospiraceae bacterium]